MLLRLKEDYDGAEPAASSIGVWNLLTMAHLEEASALEGRITQTFRGSAERLSSSRTRGPDDVGRSVRYVAGLGQIVLVGPADDPAVGRMLDVIAERYLPFTIVLPVDPRDAIGVPAFAAAFSGKGQTGTAYVCRDFTCLEPVTTPDALAAQLDARAHSRRGRRGRTTCVS